MTPLFPKEVEFRGQSSRLEVILSFSDFMEANKRGEITARVYHCQDGFLSFSAILLLDIIPKQGVMSKKHCEQWKNIAKGQTNDIIM